MSVINKVAADRNQRALLELVQKSGNDICADCKARAPRWASYNLGIFICLNCASIHRKIGTHITKVKSVTLDTWTKEQVEVMKQNGNIKSNTHYNPDEVRNPPPTNMIGSERDSELEKYIRAKYEFKRYLNRAPQASSQITPSTSSSSSFPPAPRSKAAPTRSVSAAIPSSNPPRSDSIGYRPPPTVNAKPAAQAPQIQSSRSVSQPLPSQSSSSALASPSAPQKPSNNPLWDDLISLQNPITASFPLQYQSNTPSSLPAQPFTGTNANPYANQGNPSPFDQMQMTNPTAGLLPAGSMAGGINTGIGMGMPNPFQQQQVHFDANRPATFSPTSNPGMGSLPHNPFTQSYLPPATSSPFAGMSTLPQSPPFHSQVQPFSQTPAAQQFQAQMQAQAQSQQPQSQPAGLPFFQPQSHPSTQQPQQPQLMQSPFTQQPSPFGQQPSPFGQQPSPYGSPQQQLQPQLPHQPQQMLSPGNPFASWQQQQQQQPRGYPNQQGGFQGQQWNGM